MNLTRPVTRLGCGPFSFDPIEQMIGCPLADILESLMTRLTYGRLATGAEVEAYPLALPRGEGASIPLSQWGEIGFANRDGLLALTVPWGMSDRLRGRLEMQVVKSVTGVSLC